jgi:hypothetical protein
MVLTSCGQSSQNTPALSRASDSPEDVCRNVLEALAASDTVALHNFVLTRFEHDSILVPQLPIGRDTSGSKDLELAWYMLNQRSIEGIRRALADHAGQRLEFVSVEFKRPKEVHGPLTIHKGTQVKVRTENGEEVVLGIFGSILEQNGRYKLVSIRD